MALDSTHPGRGTRPVCPPANLYVHFPFCRRKCTYCVLHSRAGVSQADRAAYVARVAEALVRDPALGVAPSPRPTFNTIYFGGGSPALCDLTPLGPALSRWLSVPKSVPSAPSRTQPNGTTTQPTPSCEFTVELHPLDVTRAKLEELKRLGVNRISMGVQSLDDDILRHMGRGYTFAEAERAFYLVKEYFDNAGIDLIVGYPGETAALTPRHARLAKWGLKHCSVYSLQLEEGSILTKMMRLGLVVSPERSESRSDALAGVRSLRERRADEPALPDDETVLNRLSIVSRFLKDLGLERYEISNYAVPGYECRHNLATWRGEDYLGIGDGACGRVGLTRTRNGEVIETVTPERDAVERRLFSLRTREGLDTTGFPQWVSVLERFVSEGLLERAPRMCSRGREHYGEMATESQTAPVYRLTERGTEVCDSILAELV